MLLHIIEQKRKFITTLNAYVCLHAILMCACVHLVCVVLLRFFSSTNAQTGTPKALTKSAVRCKHHRDPNIFSFIGMPSGIVFVGWTVLQRKWATVIGAEYQ